MVKGFQKPANNAPELQLTHSGIINPDAFAELFELHCYEPSPDLQPFVTHIWTQRLKRPLGQSSKPPVEIVSGPNVYLFFTAKAAFIHDVASLAFSYNPLASKVIAGVKFKPGGFYPFLRHSVSDLHVVASPLTSVFPKADEAFTANLLAQPNETIVSMLENLLRDSAPQRDKNLDLVTDILHTLAADASLRTVGATARAFDMSERSLQLLFRTYVGVGVKWIITRRRLLEIIVRAQDQPDPAWAEMAAELGYSSQSHFSREFKGVTGLTPSEYIKSLRQV